MVDYFNLAQIGKNMRSLLLSLLLALASSKAVAVNANYYGVITRIAFMDNQGSFVVTVDLMWSNKTGLLFR